MNAMKEILSKLRVLTISILRMINELPNPFHLYIILLGVHTPYGPDKPGFITSLRKNSKTNRPEPGFETLTNEDIIDFRRIRQ